MIEVVRVGRAAVISELKLVYQIGIENMKQLDGAIDWRRRQLLQVLKIITRACQRLRIDRPVEVEAHKCGGLF